MTPTTETTAASEASAVKVIEQVVKQSQKVLNLETGEDTQITVVQTKYIAPSYEPKYGTEAEFETALFDAASSLMGTNAKRIDAFLYRATQDSYQAGKTAALSAGKFLTSDLKARIIQVMRGNVAFAEASAKDCYDRWVSGYLGTRGEGAKNGATKVLRAAEDMGDFGDL